MRFKFGREYYTPKGATKISDKKSDAVAYISETKTGKPYATVFFGKQAKPVANYSYRSTERRAQHVAQLFADRQASLEFKAKIAAERKAFVNPYKVGDIFKNSWGYDQTNVNYYEAIEVKGKFVTVREISQKAKETGFMSGQTTPLPGAFLTKSEPKRCLAQAHGIKVEYGWASLVKPQMIGGVPVYGTTYWSSYA